MKANDLVRGFIEGFVLVVAYHFGGGVCLAVVALGWWASNLIKRFWR